MAKNPNRYVDPDTKGSQHQGTFTPSSVGKMGKNRQRDIMRHWFYERFEDPVNGMPYDSEEGGYMYINGGPFDALEELQSEFGDIVKPQVIEELAKELENKCVEWTHTDSYDQQLWPSYEIDAALENPSPLIDLEKSLGLLQQLLEVKDSSPPLLHKFQLMMIYGFCITSLEAYLSDVFAKAVMMEKKRKIKYLEAEKSLMEQKISLSQIFDKFEQIDGLIKKKISETTFHNLGRVKVLFKAVLDVDLGDISKLAELINKRHDFVHRGGKDMDGIEVTTTKPEVEDLIQTINGFCSKVDVQMIIAEFDVF